MRRIKAILKLYRRTCSCSLLSLFSSNSDHQLNFSNNCLKAHSINLIFYGDGKNLYEYFDSMKISQDKIGTLADVL